MTKFDIAEGASMKVEFHQSAIGLQNLLRKTKFHPEGRVQLDENNEIKNQKHNVVEVKEIPINITTDKGKKIQIGIEKIDVNGGLVKGYHAITGKQEDCVWRNSLNGPQRFHELVLKKAEIKRRDPTTKDQVTPELQEEEFKEYVLYVEFMKESKKKLPGNVEFYEWIEENDVSIDDEGNIVRDKKKKEKTTDKGSAKSKS